MHPLIDHRRDHRPVVHEFHKAAQQHGLVNVRTVSVITDPLTIGKTKLHPSTRRWRWLKLHMFFGVLSHNLYLPSYLKVLFATKLGKRTETIPPIFCRPKHCRVTLVEKGVVGDTGPLRPLGNHPDHF